MRDFVIVTDSSCDLPRQVAKKMDVAVISLEVNIEDVGTKLNHEIDIKEFYEFLRSKKSAKTSAANMDRFIATFEPFLADGKDILYIGFSSGLSATYMASKNAAEELSEKYPDAKIFTVDSLCASLGQGLIVTLAARKRDSGATIDEVRDYVESIKLNLCHWFTVDDLFFLKRGGRVSGATAVLGSILSIKPVMHVDNEGHLINVEKARGRSAAIKALVEKMKATVIEPATQTVYISHGDCYDDAKKLADMVTEEFGITDILISEVGPVIGAHSGPGTLALFFLGTER
jgi:DegV family protein with EDD domain